MTKKSLCFIGNHQTVTLYISNQLSYFLGEYVEVKSWCLEHMQIPLDCHNCDIYVASSYTALNKIKDFLPAHKKVIVAARTLNTQKLDNILELTPGTKVLVVANSQETAQTAINLIVKVGIDYLEFIPYYPGIDSKKVPDDVHIAVTTGLAHLAPSNINKTIDLGVKELDLSTYVELILELDLPKELINNISQYYIEEIFKLTIRMKNAAQSNSNLKRKLEVIINTVGEAILAINKDQEIILVNSALENLLGINRFSIIGKKLQKIIPQIDLSSIINQNLSIVNNIQQINKNFYILSANRISDDQGLAEGVVATLKPVGEVQELETKVRRELNKHGNIAKYNFSDIIGDSQEINEIKELARQFAQTDLTVLIEGESGTGKELFAQAIHNASNRKHGPFVAINFAALPENLVESELFGYEEGAFTGAKKGGKSGLFEEAHRGTIFLDEIGDAPLDVQKKLLRILEEREVRRVGGRTVTPIDVRVIAATNQDLRKLVEENKFRDDLFFRLCTLPICIPPLRERKEDILILIDYFSQKFNNRRLELDSPVKEFLLKYRWPGNIRELENVVKYMCSIVPENELATIKHLPLYLARNQHMKSDYPNFKPYKDQKFELAIQEFQNQNLLSIVIFILKEIQNVSLLDKGLGRSALLKRLNKCTTQKFPDHKLRQLLNTLAKMGFIKPGKTKQGTKITPEGNNFLKYLQANYNNKAVNN